MSRIFEQMERDFKVKVDEFIDHTDLILQEVNNTKYVFNDNGLLLIKENTWLGTFAELNRLLGID